MTAVESKLGDETMMAALALALVEKPRATLQELAKSIGVSKATLYRSCRTREELVEKLMSYGAELMQRSLATAALEDGTAEEALRRVIHSQLEHREMGAFLTYHWKPDTLQDERWFRVCAEFETALDAFFLRYQRAGYFRVDVSAAVLTESLFSLIVCVIDAERRGRIARGGMASVVESIFLTGAKS